MVTHQELMDGMYPPMTRFTSRSYKALYVYLGNNSCNPVFLYEDQLNPNQGADPFTDGWSMSRSSPEFSPGYPEDHLVPIVDMEETDLWE